MCVTSIVPTTRSAAQSLSSPPAGMAEATRPASVHRLGLLARLPSTKTSVVKPCLLCD